MSQWKFTDASNTVVIRTTEEGETESCLFSVLPEEEVVEPADPEPEVSPVVYSCSPWQIREALNILELRAAVEDAVKVSEDQKVKDGWFYAKSFDSSHPFVLNMGASLGKTEEETVELIRYAATL